jgi:acid stress-induced BolA-like protein IbaG/YrbA
MDPDKIKELLEDRLVDCQIKVEVDGSHVNLVVIGDIFVGKRPVQRQQLVYGALKEQIAAGTIHAVNMKTYTSQEWQQLA